MSEAPAMLSRPTDPSEPLESLRNGELMTALHAEYARVHAAPANGAQRVRDKARTLVTRLGLKRDDALLGDLVRALDAIAGRCDDLSERIHNLEVTVDDLSRTHGEEITRLRAAVRRSTTEGPPESPSQQ